MNKFLLITKINLLSFFNLQKVNNSQYKSVNKKKYFRLLILVAAFLYLAYYVYYLSYNLMPGLISLNIPHFLFGMLFLIVSVFIITSNFLRVKGILFDFKDYDLLFSMPIKRNIIILSKLASLYILNLIYTLLFMVPGLVAYLRFLPLNNILLYIILLFIIPVFPMMIAIIIGIFLSLIASKFINKTVGNYIVNISVIAIAFFVSFKLNNMSSVDIANISSNSINRVGNFYPLVNIFLRLFTDFNFLDLLLFLLIPFGSLVIMIGVINRLYEKIRSGLIKNYTHDDYKIREYQVNKPMVSLYKKEIKRFFSNSLYPLNTIFGCFLLILLIIGLLLFNDNTIAKLLNVTELKDFLQKQILMIICICCVLSSTTHCSISLEGKSFWIIRMLPIKGIKVLVSKILVNLTFLIPTILIVGTFFGIYLHLNLTDFIILYLMPISYTLFISQLGLLLNLFDPKFDYTSEMQVIKQAMPVFLTMIIGLISVILPLSLHELTTSYSILVTMVLFIVDLILFAILDTYGVKKLERI